MGSDAQQNASTFHLARLENGVEIKNGMYTKGIILADNNSNISSSSSVPSEYISTAMQQRLIHRVTSSPRSSSKKPENDMRHSVMREQRNDNCVTKTEEPGESALVRQCLNSVTDLSSDERNMPDSMPAKDGGKKVNELDINKSYAGSTSMKSLQVTEQEGQFVNTEMTQTIFSGSSANVTPRKPNDLDVSVASISLASGNLCHSSATPSTAFTLSGRIAYAEVKTHDKLNTNHG